MTVRKAGFSLESRFLLDLCPVDPGAKQIDHAGVLFESGLDFDRLAKLAKANRTNNILLSHIRAGRLPIEFPEPFVRTLKEFFAADEMVAEIQSETLFEVITLLNKGGIDFTLVKGAALFATGIYKNFAIRPMVDLDFLIRPKDAGAVKRLLLENGFDHESRPGLEEEQALLGEMVFFKSGMEVMEIEFSFALIKEFGIAQAIKIDEDLILSRRAHVLQNGQSAHVLCAADALMHLIYHHLLVNYMHQIIYYTDWLALISKCADVPDETVLSSAAKMWKIEKSFAMANGLLDYYFQRPISKTGIGVAPDFTKNILIPQLGGYPDASLLKSKRQKIRLDLIGGFWTRAKAIWANLFPPATWMKKKLGPKRSQGSWWVLFYRYLLYRMKKGA